MKTPDKVAMLLEASVKDESKMSEMMLALLEQAMWFPVEYHPELGNPYEPTTDGVIPLWIGGDERGPFIPIFSSPKLMREGLERFAKRYTRARMNGRTLLAYLATRGYPVRVNPGCGATVRIQPEMLSTWATATRESVNQPEETIHGSLRPLPPDAWPAEHAALLAEACEEDDGLLAVWLGKASETTHAESADALHVMVWLRKIETTPFHNLRRAVSVAFPGQMVMYVRMDEAHHGSMAVMRSFAPVWPQAQ